MKTIHDLDITEIVAAVIDDDAASIANSLAKSLQQLKDGQYTPAYPPIQRAKKQAYHKASPRFEYIRRLNHGSKRNPSGAAALLKLLDKPPRFNPRA